jgi:hypothetical protein
LTHRIQLLSCALPYLSAKVTTYLSC